MQENSQFQIKIKITIHHVIFYKNPSPFPLLVYWPSKSTCKNYMTLILRIHEQVGRLHYIQPIQVRQGAQRDVKAY